MAPHPCSARFVHLNVHSDYSLLLSMLPIGKLTEIAAEHAFPAMALTDTNTLSGALKFSLSMWEAGIQPIAGIAVDVAFDTHRRAPPRRLTLLAMAEEGIANLLRIARSMHFDAEPRLSPRLTVAQLSAHAGGIIALTGGPCGPIDTAFADRNTQRAADRLTLLRDIYRDRLYVELQRHGLDAEADIEPRLLNLAYDLRVPVVATNECYFPKREDHPYHQYLLQIHARLMSTGSAANLVTPAHCLKSDSDMAALFADLPEALDNTIEIAVRCATRFEGRKPILPSFLKYNNDIVRARAPDIASEMVTIVIDGMPSIFDAVPVLKKLLGPSPSGKQRVRVVVENDGAPEMEVFVRGRFALSAADCAKIAAIPSVLRIEQPAVKDGAA